MPQIIRTETRRRGFFGHLIKFIFIVFNLAMAAWLVSYFVHIGAITANLQSEAEKTGAGLGAIAGTGMLMTMWFLGSAVLGLLVHFTRGAKVTVEKIISD